MELIEFFSKVNDNVLNAQVVESGTGFDKDFAHKYINDIISIPYGSFLDYIKQEEDLPFVLSSDVPQFSSIDSATSKLCKLLSERPAVAYNFEEIGRILQPGRTDDVGANRKYGENHIKTAELLGLSFAVGKKYYLSAVGHIYPLLTESQQDQLLSRMVLRSPLVFNVVHKLLVGQEVTIAEEISFLSESTVKRRKNNTLFLCRIIERNKEISVQSILDILK